MIEAVGKGHAEALTWCAASGCFTRGDRAFTKALIRAVDSGKEDAAALCLAWGGDITHPKLRKTVWVEAVRAGEIVVEPRDPPEVHASLGGFKFYD